MIHREDHEVSGFLYADGHRIRNGEGRELLLRGVGLGSWLLPEGYMWRFPERGDRPRRIEAMITELIGPEDAEVFWETYYDRYVTEADIARIAEEGFNSVRIPINARYILGEKRTGPAGTRSISRGWTGSSAGAGAIESMRFWICTEHPAARRERILTTLHRICRSCSRMSATSS